MQGWGMPLSPNALQPTADMHNIFVEHEDLMAILLAGSSHFEIEFECEVRAGKGSELNLTVFTAAIGSRDPPAPTIDFSVAFIS